MLLGPLVMLAHALGISDRAEAVALARHGSQTEIGQYLSDLRPQLAAAVKRGFPGLEQDAEDIVQDALTDMLASDARTLRAYQGRCSLSTYVLSIVRRKAIDRLRRMRVRGDVGIPEDVERTLAEARETHTPHIAAERSDQLRSIETALAQLPRRERQAVSLFYLAQQSCAEVAETLGISEKRVTGLLCEGRKRLQILLAPEVQ